MTAAPEIRGWCPGALRPMQSGDGWVVRVRPFGGVLKPAQADGLATLAAAHGNGLMDLSSRGNIQLRGIREESHAPLIEGLRGLGLVDAAADVESRRNVVVTPFWQDRDGTERLAATLAAALTSPEAPGLPGKFGFAVDTGAHPVLQDTSADIRLERDAQGGLILIPADLPVGKPVTPQTAIPQAVALARWFMTERTLEKRMVDLVARLDMDGFTTQRQRQTFAPGPGQTAAGALVGLAFGQIKAETLASLAKHGQLRMTPWRMLLVEGAQHSPQIDGLITDPADPLLRVVACVGAPRCAQAAGETHDVARMLAPLVNDGEVLHVSGCAKGCARPGAAARTVVATPNGYDVIENGKANDAPTRIGLSKQALTKAI